MSKPRPKLTTDFITKHLICSKCNNTMELYDQDTFNGITSYWITCPHCMTEGTAIETNKNGHIVFPVVITGSEGEVIRTITKDEVMR